MTLDPTRPKHAGGRPRVDPSDLSVGLHVVLPAKAYDKLYQLARARHITVPEVVRRALRPVLTPTRDPQTNR